MGFAYNGSKFGAHKQRKGGCTSDAIAVKIDAFLHNWKLIYPQYYVYEFKVLRIIEFMQHF